MQSDAVVYGALWLGEPWRREVVKYNLVWHERSYCEVGDWRPLALRARFRARAAGLQGP